MKEQQVYVCGTCGSDQIEVLAWTKMNTKEFSEWLNETDEECYCPTCGSSDRAVVTQEKYQKKQV